MRPVGPLMSSNIAESFGGHGTFWILDDKILHLHDFLHLRYPMSAAVTIIANETEAEPFRRVIALRSSGTGRILRL